MANGISKETFKGMDIDSKLDVLFDYVQQSSLNIETLKKRPVLDKCFSFAGGVIGGFMAALGLKWGG
jgi:hypothetical protein